MAEHIELNPTDFLTIDTIGQPGQRTFYIQGAQGNNLITLVIEKQQAISLADGLSELIKEISRRTGEPEVPEESLLYDLRLREPIEPLFRVGNMGLGFSEEVELFVVVAYEIPQSDAAQEEEQDAVSFWVTRDQVLALIPHTEAVVGAGRPICGNCGRPMEPEGHFCEKRNGHKH